MCFGSSLPVVILYCHAKDSWVVGMWEQIRGGGHGVPTCVDNFIIGNWKKWSFKTTFKFIKGC